MRRFSAILPVAAILLLAGPAPAQQPGPLSQQDVNFAKEAALINLAEVELGKLAQEKAENRDVKAYADLMVQSHTSALDKLRTAVRTVDLPREPDAATKAQMEALQPLSGPLFDRRYMGAMEEGHERAVKIFEAASTGDGDRDLRQYAQNLLPDLRIHRDRAKKITADLAQGEAQIQQGGETPQD